MPKALRPSTDANQKQVRHLWRRSARDGSDRLKEARTNKSFSEAILAPFSVFCRVIRLVKGTRVQARGYLI
jgi:hypothetical protein